MPSWLPRIRLLRKFFHQKRWKNWQTVQWSRMRFQQRTWSNSKNRSNNNYWRNRWNKSNTSGIFTGIFTIGPLLALTSGIERIGIHRDTNEISALFNNNDVIYNIDTDHFLKDFIIDKKDYDGKGDRNNPIKKVLVLDGGGLRGCMSIQILRQLEQEIQNISGDPNLELHQMFDLIIGTSTGGLIAIGLANKGMSLDDIDGMYNSVAKRVFNKDAGFLKKQLTKLYQGGAAVGLVGSALDTKELEAVFKEFVGADTMFEDVDPNNNAMCGVLSILCNNTDLSGPVFIRNYQVNHGYKRTQFNEFDLQTEYNLPGINYIKTWQAARATSAAPTYFEHLELDMPPELKRKVIKRNIRQCCGIGFDSDERVLTVLLDHTDRKNIQNITDKVYELLVAESGDSGESGGDGGRFGDISRFVFGDKRKDDVEAILQEIRELFGDKKEFVLDLDYKKFMKMVIEFKYTLQLQDGGLAGNAPLLYAFAESKRLWNDDNIVILSIGTGRAHSIDIYEEKQSAISLANVGSALFDAKELNSLFPLLSLAWVDVLKLERMNPEIDARRTGMADASLMKYWRRIGERYAQTHQMSIKHWAQFLTEQYYIDQENMKKNEK